MASSNPYGYVPNLGGNILFLLIAAVALLVTLIVTVSKRRYVAFGALMILACTLEVVGYSDRIYSHGAPGTLFSFIQGTVVLVIAPVFLTSSVYTILGDVVRMLGEEHSPIASELYARIFIPIDAVALLLQVIGCAVAFCNADSETGVGPKLAEGLYVAAAGLILQFISLVINFVLILAVLLRAVSAVRKHGYTTFHKDVGYVPLTRRFCILAGAVPVSIAALLVRTIYRIAELAQGSLWKEEGVFLAVESFMVAVAMISLACCHPAVFMCGVRERRMSLEKRGGVEELEAVGAVARQSGGLLSRSWSLKSWRSNRVSGPRERPAEGLQTTMCSREVARVEIP